jgi:hypothetical protein
LIAAAFAITLILSLLPRQLTLRSLPALIFATPLAAATPMPPFRCFLSLSFSFSRFRRHFVSSPAADSATPRLIFAFADAIIAIVADFFRHISHFLSAFDISRHFADTLHYLLFSQLSFSPVFRR